jgi:hypothetical protein
MIPVLKNSAKENQSELTQLLRRAKAAQCLQGRGRVRDCWLAPGLSRRVGFAVQSVIAIVAIGFPIALVIAWAFELMPEGLKRAEEVIRKP